MELLILPALTDNYIYLLRAAGGTAVMVVDPAEAGPVVCEVDRLGWQVAAVLNTHHHQDHIGGSRELKERYRCPVLGPAADAARFPDLTLGVGEGDRYNFEGEMVEVIETPGHTSSHLAYYLPGPGLLFCGDTLFSLGCGRLFEGTAAVMWRSLGRLAGLPGPTKVCCAHEYTLSNARFALTIERDNQALSARVQQAQQQRDRGQPTVPSTLAEELATNPFLRADQPAVRAALGMAAAAAAEVFGELRRRKDHF